MRGLSLSAAGYGTWTSTPTAPDNNPMGCMTFFEAHAFCAWDNAWSSTEVELNYAQVGGDEQRMWPWSSPPSMNVVDISCANFNAMAGSPNFPVSCR
ncbi:MAG: formylglycine-generating enzyme family protein [Polyangiaceae bacterium]|jgi:formylglycine-generating enzyme required for sulfatase activity|nr:formylglycine-generating enzyme family protein [Polyangiaceae bacterium]